MINEQLHDALTALYDDTVEYITINNLGDPHHNAVMKQARDALRDSDAHRAYPAVKASHPQEYADDTAYEMRMYHHRHAPRWWHWWAWGKNVDHVWHGILNIARARYEGGRRDD